MCRSWGGYDIWSVKTVKTGVGVVVCLCNGIGSGL